MKFKFKYLVAGTLACLTTLAPATHRELMGFQSDQPTLESLLRRAPASTRLVPQSAPGTAAPMLVQPVAYLSQEKSDPIINPLQPRAAIAPSPLVPVRSGAIATPLPAPIIGSATKPTATVAPITGNRQVPIVSGVSGGPILPNVPIITSPLSSNITSTKLDPAIGSGLKPTMDVTTPAPILGSMPSTVATPVTNGPAPIVAATPVPALPAALAPATTVPSVSNVVPPIAPSAQPIKPNPPTIAASQESTKPRDPVAPQTTPSGDDEIQVSEISAEDLTNLMQSFGVTPKVPAMPSSTKERVETIGSGAILAQPTSQPMPSSAASMSSPITTASAPQGVEPLYETYGLNLGHNRPSMPTRLPYDGYGTISGASDYLFTEFLYMARDGGDFTASYAPQQESYGFEPGARITFGRRLDSIEGREIGFTVMETMTSHTSVASPTDSLFTWIQPGSGYNASNLSSFNDANYHHSFSKSHYYSGEYNRVNWNWDVMSTFIGLRYTGMDELYALHSVGSSGGLGAYRLRARNHMVGPQAGGTLHYDIGRKLSFSVAAKIAAYANFYQTDTEFANNTVRLMDVKDSRADLAWGTELACFAHYSLTPRARIKGGYELWFYDGIATSEGQATGFVSPFSGSVARNGDEALFYGLSLGLEIFR